MNISIGIIFFGGLLQIVNDILLAPRFREGQIHVLAREKIGNKINATKLKQDVQYFMWLDFCIKAATYWLAANQLLIETRPSKQQKIQSNVAPLLIL